MAKDKRLAQLPGISAAAVVALERLGLLNCSDLMNADFERVAYVLDDYNEATRLVREARRICGGSGSKESGDPLPPGPLGATVATRMPRTMQKGAAPAAAPTGEIMDLSHAIGALGMGLGGAQDQSTLRRRLSAMLAILEHDGSEAELLATALLDAVESGLLEIAEVSQRFGKPTARLLEQCMTLRAVPVLPSGKLPPMYITNARNAPLEVRRVCAAHLAALADSEECPEGTYMRLHLEALQAGGDDELVDAAASLVNPKRRAA
jgi:hypothetical protein